MRTMDGRALEVREATASRTHVRDERRTIVRAKQSRAQVVQLCPRCCIELPIVVFDVQFQFLQDERICHGGNRDCDGRGRCTPCISCRA